jgi:hypothetical protein
MRTPWSVSVIALLVVESHDAFAEAETYEQVRVDTGITASRASVPDRNGVGFTVEIKAMLHDRLAIGGRVELAMMFGGDIGRGEALPLQFAIAACGLLDGEFFIADIGEGLLRPWVGIGAGAYTIGGQTIASGPDHSGVSQTTGGYFGVAPQVGIDVGRVRFAATYNAILGATLVVRHTVGTVEQTYEYSQNYLSLELSFRFGGGRKRPVHPTQPVYPCCG